MKDQQTNTPPRWAQRLLEWYCKPELLEDLQGDLHEYYQRHCTSKGILRANLIYIANVLKFFRSYTIRKPSFINVLIHWIMLGSYIKTSGRSIVRNKLFSTINIAGLAISMSVGLIVIAMISDANRYDKFHTKHDRIYRLISQYEYNGRKDADFNATTSLVASKIIKESFAGVEDVAILQGNFGNDVSAEEKTIPLSGYWANQSFFNVFSFKLIQGNASRALNDPFSVVLTEQSARKLFGDVNVVGKTIRLNDRDFIVTGVLENAPKFSHIQFDMLCSLSTGDITEKNNKRRMAWDNIWGTWSYLLVPENSDLSLLKSNLDELSKEQDKTVDRTHVELALQPMDEIIAGENLSNQNGPVLGKTTVWILSTLTVIIILSAALNYTNLSIARAFGRAREVGIRKSIGAQRSQVTHQFLTESVVIALLALVIAFGLFTLIKPHFMSLEHTLQKLLVMDLSLPLILSFILFAVIVGILAGIFPALFFARMNAVQVLKNLSAVPVPKGITFRKGLIVFQSCISIIAITTTLILYKEYKHFISYDLGFTTENILNIPLQGNKPEILKKGLSEMHEVKAISQSQLITSIGDYWGVKMKNPNTPMDSAFVNYTMVDENYLPLHDHKLVAGRNFNHGTEGAEESEVIVNEKVLKRFNIGNGNPALALDEIVEVDNKSLRIIGVIKDFQYGRANSESGKEVIIRYSNSTAEYLNVKILSSDWPETYSRIEALWKTVDPVHPFGGKFYNEQIEEAFAGLKASMKLGSFLAFLVICISSIGLLGMVVFTTETRIKEISIRKVLGASENGLMFQLSKGFLLLLAIAGAIALPVTYIFFENILLPKIANHLPVGAMELLIGLFSVMLVALFMICSQTLKVARTNPADVLKSE